jgi:predicted kinase
MRIRNPNFWESLFAMEAEGAMAEVGLLPFARIALQVAKAVLPRYQREQLLLAACLQGRQPFVIDNTNPSASDRARYIAPARVTGFRVVVYSFEASLLDAIRRNNQRGGKEKILAATFRKLQVPTQEGGRHR